MIVREGRNATPNGREGFSDWLADRGVVGLQGVDTRAITRRLRDGGSVRGAVSTGTASIAEVLELVRGEPAMVGRALAAGVSRRASPRRVAARGPERAHVAVLDYGVKSSIVRLLSEAGARVTVFPWDCGAAEVLALAARRRSCSATAPATRRRCPAASRWCATWSARCRCSASAWATSCSARPSAWRPSSSASAIAARTIRCSSSTPGGCSSPPRTTASPSARPTRAATFDTRFGRGRVTHVSLYDGTVEGLELPGLPVSSVQFHPEASPGPHDARDTLTEFVGRLAQAAPRAVA